MMLPVLLRLAVLLVALRAGEATGSCLAVKASELGDVAVPNATGLIAASTIAGDLATPPNVQLFAFTEVCLAVAEARGMYRYASVVARYSCAGVVTANSPIPCETISANYTAQFDLECDPDGNWILSVTPLAVVTGVKEVFLPSHGGFDTSLRKDCSLCVDPTASSRLGLAIDNSTHCAACHVDCLGLGYCTGILQSDCCNYYSSEMCVTQCPEPLVADADFICGVGCESLSVPVNGSVDYTAEVYYAGVMATYSCNNGYILSATGDSVRTCENGTWTGATPSCQIVDCGNLIDPDSGNVQFSVTTYGSEAVYTCNAGYRLVGGARRTCQDSGQWSGQEPICDIVDCGRLSDPENGKVQYTETTYGSEASYVCDAGYAPQDTTPSRVCQEDGQWNGQEPTCACADQSCERGTVCRVKDGKAECVVNTEDDLSAGEIAGIVLGCFLLLVLILVVSIIVVVLIILLRQDKLKRQEAN